MDTSIENIRLLDIIDSLGNTLNPDTGELTKQKGDISKIIDDIEQYENSLCNQMKKASAVVANDPEQAHGAWAIYHLAEIQQALSIIRQKIKMALIGEKIRLVDLKSEGVSVSAFFQVLPFYNQYSGYTQPAIDKTTLVEVMSSIVKYVDNMREEIPMNMQSFNEAVLRAHGEHVIGVIDYAAIALINRDMFSLIDRAISFEANAKYLLSEAKKAEKQAA